MRAVNLLPREVPTKSFEAKRGVVFGAGGSINEQQGQLDTLNAELAALPRPDPQAGDSGVDALLAAEKNERITALSSALSSRIAWDRVLRQVSQVLPEDVWLTRFTSQAEGTPDPGTTEAPGASVILTGSTYSHSGVARLLARLGVLPALSSVQLQSSATLELEPRDIVQFTIHIGIKPPGAAQ